MLTEVETGILSVGSDKKIQVGSFRVDPHGNQEGLSSVSCDSEISVFFRFHYELIGAAHRGCESAAVCLFFFGVQVVQSFWVCLSFRRKRFSMGLLVSFLKLFFKFYFGMSRAYFVVLEEPFY